MAKKRTPASQPADILEPIQSPVKAQSAAVKAAAVAPVSDTKDSFEKIAKDLDGCTRCKLSQSRTNIVIGAGDRCAKMLFVGEAPGEQEDLDAVPFVGRSGKLLEKLIGEVGLTRENVYISNIVKCRPPENRNPEADEIAACSPFLKRQIALINPQVVVALGKFSSQTLLATETSISDLRGNFHEYENRKLMPTFHPAYLLRSPSAQVEAREDLKKAVAEIK